MVVPALIYWFINRDNPAAVAGWAIPTATDIAFALGVLALLGKRVPVSLKLFLMTLAIIDDLGAIIVIALFYSGTLSSVSLLLAAACLVVLIAMNRLGVVKLGPHGHWPDPLGLRAQERRACHAGRCRPGLVHPTAHAQRRNLAAAGPGTRPAPWVAYAILPLFAFANAGVSLAGVTVESFTHPVPMGIAVGLLLGKTVGVFGLTWLAVKLRLAALPAGPTGGRCRGGDPLRHRLHHEPVRWLAGLRTG
jgi:NhaA family Na+:H+ antiporter